MAQWAIAFRIAPGAANFPQHLPRGSHWKCDPKEVPEFIKYVHYEVGESVVFNATGIGRLTTLVCNKNDDCLFAMRAVCANIVQEIRARQTTYLSLRAYYEVLISAIPHYYDDTGIIWPHDYFGAIEYWVTANGITAKAFKNSSQTRLKKTKTAT